jgi:hypothetical protein
LEEVLLFLIVCLFSDCSKWEQWILPSPFSSLPNPRPHFAGSEFCTEQYALGNAIEQFETFNYSSREEIFLISRKILALCIRINAIREYFPDLLQQPNPNTSALSSYFATTSFSSFVLPKSSAENSNLPLYVDNILSGSIIHTFGTNNAIVTELYFDNTIEMSLEMRTTLASDFISKRVCTRYRSVIRI